MSEFFDVPPMRPETAGETEAEMGDVDRNAADTQGDIEPDSFASAPGDTPGDAAGESGDPGGGPR